MSRYDIVVMGAGHNGLTAAAYLAKAGKKVLVLERKAWPGGGVATRELTVPGWKHDEHSNVHIMIQGNPLLREDELGLLSKYGLEYYWSDIPHCSLFIDGTTLFTYKDLDKTCASIATVSEKDAETYRAFAKRAATFLPMFAQGLYAPPAPLGPMMAMMDMSDEGREMMDFMTRSALDLCNQLFESDKVKMHFWRLVTENLQSPDDLGTGMGILLMPGIIHSWGVSAPIGGSGKLTEALVRCIEAYGGEVRCNAEVKRVLVSGGKATGLEMEDGEIFHAKDAVIGAIHPHKLRSFVQPIEEPILKRAERVTLSPFSILLSHYALNEPIKLRFGGPDAHKASMVEYIGTTKQSELLDDFDNVRRGRMPVDRPLAAGGDNSHTDPTRVPPGKGIYYGVTFAPYELADGAHWDDVKEEYADRSKRHYQKFIENFTDENIVARVVKSPLDMERSSPNSMVRGDLHGAAPYLHQSLGHRPTPDLGQYTVPGVENLYLVGPFMHPGGGVFGAGRATAIKISMISGSISKKW